MSRRASRVVVIGAGPAGLTAALELCRHGVACTVLEGDAEYVGGLARTVEYAGFRFDLGGHRFFSKNREIEEWWGEILAPDDFIEVARQSRIFYDRKFYDYPLKPLNALSNLGVAESLLCIAAYLYRSVRPLRPERSFQDWVSNRFGDRLFRIFFKSYTEKVWGMKCHEISADWAAQRIRGLSLRVAALNAFGIGSGKRDGAAVKTLTDTFKYPRLGPGMMWERVRDLIEEAGGEVLLDRRVVAVQAEESRATSVTAEDSARHRFSFDCDAVINSMPLQSLIRCWSPQPPAHLLEEVSRLRYRDFLIVSLIASRSDIFPDNWIYVHDPSVRAGRVQNYGNWSADMVPDADHSVLGVEYFCSKDGELWLESDAALVQLATGELSKLNLIAPEEIIDGAVVRVPKAYPVYDDKYKDVVSSARAFLGRFNNVWTVGRNGMHKYNNQDHSMMTALLAARNYLGCESRDPWSVNTDAEYLEERRVPQPAV